MNLHGNNLSISGSAKINVFGSVNNNSANLKVKGAQLNINKNLNNNGNIYLIENSFSSIIVDSLIVLNDSADIHIGNNIVALKNSQVNALQSYGGKFIINDTTLTGGFSWQIGEDSGKYSIPLANSERKNIDIDIEVLYKGVDAEGETGTFLINSYHTLNNNLPLPEGIKDITDNNNNDISNKVLDRYWLLQTSGYGVSPIITPSFKYTHDDLNNNSIDEDSLIVAYRNAKNWEQTSSTLQTSNNKIAANWVKDYGIFTVMDKQYLLNDKPTAYFEIEAINLSGVFYEISGGGLNGIYNASKTYTFFPEIDPINQYADIQLKITGLPDTDTLKVLFKTGYEIKMAEVMLMLYKSGEGYMNKQIPASVINGRDRFNNPNISLLQLFNFTTGAFNNACLNVATYGQNVNYNWTLTKTFNEGNKIVSESITYLDALGRPLQTQQRNLATNQIIASQTIYDALGRPSVYTLPATIENKCFEYLNDFVQSAGGSLYNYKDFDVSITKNNWLGEKHNPKPVIPNNPGTLGYYYSNNNTQEKHIPSSGYPFYRVEYASDAADGIHRMSGIGAEHVLGSGHETKSYTMSSAENELSYAFRKHFGYRVKDVPNGAPFEVKEQTIPGSIVAHKKVNVDADGLVSIQYSNSQGQVIASCLSGLDNTGCLPQIVNKLIDYNVFSSVDIHLPASKKNKLKLNVPLEPYGSSLNYDLNNNQYQYRITDLLTDKLLEEGTGKDYTIDNDRFVVFNPPYNTGHGFFRIALVFTQDFYETQYPYNTNMYKLGWEPSGVIEYELDYSNFSLNYYDLKGRLKKTVAPKDVDCSYNPVYEETHLAEAVYLDFTDPLANPQLKNTTLPDAAAAAAQPNPVLPVEVPTTPQQTIQEMNIQIEPHMRHYIDFNLDLPNRGLLGGASIDGGRRCFLHYVLNGTALVPGVRDLGNTPLSPNTVKDLIIKNNPFINNYVNSPNQFDYNIISRNPVYIDNETIEEEGIVFNAITNEMQPVMMMMSSPNSGTDNHYKSRSVIDVLIDEGNIPNVWCPEPNLCGLNDPNYKDICPCGGHGCPCGEVANCPCGSSSLCCYEGHILGNPVGVDCTQLDGNEPMYPCPPPPVNGCDRQLDELIYFKVFVELYGEDKNTNNVVRISSVPADYFEVLVSTRCCQLEFERIKGGDFYIPTGILDDYNNIHFKIQSAWASYDNTFFDRFNPQKLYHNLLHYIDMQVVAVTKRIPLPQGIGASSLYAYDAENRLVAGKTPDTGISEIQYDQENKPRFTQNDEQRNSGKFSYINYDRAGRPLETGEYDATATANNGNNLPYYFVPKFDTHTAPSAYDDVSFSLDISLSTSNSICYDRVFMTYDMASVNDFPTSLNAQEYPQRYTLGRLTKSSNEHQTTWYGYSDLGNNIFAVNDIAGLGIKTINYKHEFIGTTKEVAYQKEDAQEAFFHYFFYNENAQMRKVYTSMALINQPTEFVLDMSVGQGSPSKLQAAYQYYPHGSLKRVELARGLQGLDYTYTIHGWLKAINSAKLSSADPGKDGSGNRLSFAPDMFGLEIDYYTGDYKRLNTGIGTMGSEVQQYNGGTPVATPITNRYNGTIKATRWQTATTANYHRWDRAILTMQNKSVLAYGYAYDNQYRLSNAIFGYAANSLITSNTLRHLVTEDYKLHNLTYDANGNLQKLTRRGNGTDMDDLDYSYTSGKNQLATISDAIASNNYVDNEIPAGIYNFTYNDIGQMISDGSEGYSITYNSMGLVANIKNTNNNNTLVSYAYDQAGNRLRKRSFNNSGVPVTNTYYVRDAAGTVMSIYEQDIIAATTTQTELPVYGMGTIGIIKTGISSGNRTKLKDLYSLSDHLGNIRLVLEDRLNAFGQPVIAQYADYYPFGSLMPGRSLNPSNYRYSYQNQEKDNETGYHNFELRQYASLLGRWMTPDPYGQHYSPYLAMSNNPVSFIDPDGGTDGPYGWIPDGPSQSMDYATGVISNNYSFGEVDIIDTRLEKGKGIRTGRDDSQSSRDVINDDIRGFFKDKHNKAKVAWYYAKKKVKDAMSSANETINDIDNFMKGNSFGQIIDEGVEGKDGQAPGLVKGFAGLNPIWSVPNSGNVLIENVEYAFGLKDNFPMDLYGVEASSSVDVILATFGVIAPFNPGKSLLGPTTSGEVFDGANTVVQFSSDAGWLDPYKNQKSGKK